MNQSEIMKLRWKDPIFWRKMSDAQKGKRHSLETCRKIGDIVRGRITSEETKKRISIKSKLYQAAHNTKKTIYCLFCKNSKTVKQARKTKFCDKHCYSAWQRTTLPENCNAYIDGRSSEPYPFGWKRLRNIIRQRDGYRCQSCGVPQSECNSSLCVHHIDHVKSNVRASNLISLCISCHVKLHIRNSIGARR